MKTINREEQLKQRIKKLEEELENLTESEERYKTVFKTSPDAISITDINGIYIDVNKGFSSMSEYKQEEVIGKSTIELNIWGNISDRDKLIIPLKKYGYVNDIEADFRTKSGKIKKGLMSAQIIKIKGINYTLSITKDITARKNSETMLKETLEKEKKLGDLVRKAPIAIGIGRLDGTILNFNDKFAELTGYSPEELLQINFLKLTPPKWQEYELEKLKYLIKTKKDIKYEKEYIKKDGTIIPIEMNVIGIFNEDKRLIEFIGFIQDISKRKETEKIITRNQLLKTVGEMASSVAHDFNNSLQVILGNIELLLDIKGIPEQTEKHLKTINSAANDAKERVRLLQRLGDKKQIKNEFKFIDLEYLLDEVIIQTRPLWKDQIERKGFEIKINKKYEQNIRIKGNSGELRAVFYNIIKNSIEAMPKGGKITITTSTLSNKISIKIKDNGNGISEEIQSKIFQPFFSTKGFGIGRGLGLSGAFSIIQEHKGSISLYSETNKGTEFTIILPYNEFEFEEKNKEENPSKKYLKKHRILLVDDEEMLQNLGVRMLNKIGHLTDSVSNGFDALKQLNKNKYDIIITDIGMPKMNGWQLIEQIKKQINYSPKIIILTGWGGEISKEKIKSYNIDGILEKPVTIQQMKDLISKIMQNNSRNSN